MNELFHKIAVIVSAIAGSSYAFIAACLLISLWAINGPAFHFSDTWQLVINTGTTIVTFLMVFLIQNTQQRDAKALHLKLDELLRSTKTARDSFLNVEDMSNDELEKLHIEFKLIHEKYVQEIERRTKKSLTPK